VLLPLSFIGVPSSVESRVANPYQGDHLEMRSKQNQAKDPFEIAKLYKYLRVVDVCDALDGIGYFEVGRMWPEIRPIWLGMKYFGVALTIR